MLKIYYKIWVSLYVKIKAAQKGNHKAALLLSLIVITGTNILNYFLISYLLIVLFGVNISIVNIMNFENKFVSIAVTVLVFLIPNYFLLFYNQKYNKLLEKYENENNTKLGLYYYIFSCLFIFTFLFLTIIFPHFFGLVKK